MMVDDKPVKAVSRHLSELFPEGRLPNIGDPDVDPKRNVGNIGGVVRVSESSGRSPLLRVHCGECKIGTSIRYQVLWCANSY